MIHDKGEIRILHTTCQKRKTQVFTNISGMSKTNNISKMRDIFLGSKKLELLNIDPKTRGFAKIIQSILCKN